MPPFSILDHLFSRRSVPQSVARMQYVALCILTSVHTRNGCVSPMTCCPARMGGKLLCASCVIFGLSTSCLLMVIFLPSNVKHVTCPRRLKPSLMLKPKLLRLSRLKPNPKSLRKKSSILAQSHRTRKSQKRQKRPKRRQLVKMS